LVAISSRAPKKIFVAVVALMSLRNAPLLLAVGDRLPNQLEVILQEGFGEALHELHRLSQFDLENDGQILVAAEALEVQVRELLSRSAGSSIPSTAALPSASTRSSSARRSRRAGRPCL
jgi:hypothetical protein